MESHPSSITTRMTTHSAEQPLGPAAQQQAGQSHCVPGLLRRAAALPCCWLSLQRPAAAQGLALHRGLPPAAAAAAAAAGAPGRAPASAALLAEARLQAARRALPLERLVGRGTEAVTARAPGIEQARARARQF